LSTTCPAALVYMRSLAKAGRVMKRHSCSNAWPAIVGAAANGGVQAEAVDVGAQRLLEVRVHGHRALHHQHLLACARAEGDAISRARTQTVQWTVCAWRGAGPLARRGLQRPEHASLVRIAVVVSHAVLAMLFDEHTLAGEQLASSG